MHTIYYENCPHLLSMPFVKRESGARNKKQFEIKRTLRYRYSGRRTLRYRGSILCNAIDNKLKEELGTVVFKNNIKHHVDFIKKFSSKYGTCI